MATVRSMRFVPMLGVALVAVLLLAAGCGGGSTLAAGSSADEVAGIVPANVPLLVAVETDPRVGAVAAGRRAARQVPGPSERLLDSLRRRARRRGARRRAGRPARARRRDLPRVPRLRERGRERRRADPAPRPGEVRGAAARRRTSRCRHVRSTAGRSSPRATPRSIASPPRARSSRTRAWFSDAQARVEDEALVTLFANGAAIHDARARVAAGRLRGARGATARLEYATGVPRCRGRRRPVPARRCGRRRPGAPRRASRCSRTFRPAHSRTSASPGFDSSLFDAGDLAGCDLDSQGLPGAEGFPDVDELPRHQGRTASPTSSRAGSPSPPSAARSSPR